MWVGNLRALFILHYKVEQLELIQARIETARWLDPDDEDFQEALDRKQEEIIEQIIELELVKHHVASTN
jgi:hypothetical protein